VDSNRVVSLGGSGFIPRFPKSPLLTSLSPREPMVIPGPSLASLSLLTDREED